MDFLGVVDNFQTFGIFHGMYLEMEGMVKNQSIGSITLVVPTNCGRAVICAAGFLELERIEIVEWFLNNFKTFIKYEPIAVGMENSDSFIVDVEYFWRKALILLYD